MLAVFVVSDAAAQPRQSAGNYDSADADGGEGPGAYTGNAGKQRNDAQPFSQAGRLDSRLSGALWTGVGQGPTDGRPRNPLKKLVHNYPMPQLLLSPRFITRDS